MAFLPVGVDENNKFPPAVQADLNATYERARPVGVSDFVNSWWCAPRSLHSSLRGCVYQGGIDAQGTIFASRLDLRRRTSERFRLGTFEVDDHNVPAFLIEEDKPPIVAYARHAVENFVRVRIGTVRHDLGTLGDEIQVSFPGPTTYVHLHRRPATDTIALMTRLNDGWWMRVSRDWGATWGPAVRVHGLAYCTYDKYNGVAHYAITTHPITTPNNAIRYLRISLETGVITNAAGTVLDNLWNFSGTVIPSASMTYVRQSYDTDTGHNTNRVFDLNPDGSILAMQLHKDTPGQGGMYGVYRYATTGASPSSSQDKDAPQRGWVFEPIVASGVPVGYYQSSYVGGMTSGANKDEVYLAREAAGVWTFERWTKANGTWSLAETLLRRDDGTKLGRPEIPWGAEGTGLFTGVEYFRYPEANFGGYYGDQIILETATRSPLPGSDVTPPGVPTSLAATAGADYADLSWTASTGGPIAYDIYSGSTRLATVVGTSHRVTGLNAGQTYTFSIRAVDAAGNKSSSVNFPAVTPTSVPTRDPILTDNGSLLLVEPASTFTAWSSGVPSDGATVPNLASASYPVAVVNDLTATDGILERTPKGGLHAIISQSTGAMGRSFDLVAPELRAYLAANTTHSFYISAWVAVTRRSIEATPTPQGRFVGFLTSGHSDIQGVRLVSNNKLSVAPSANRTAVSESATPVALETPHLVKAAHSAINTAGTDVFLQMGHYHASAPNVNASWILYRAYLEDLTVTGRTYAEVSAIDQSLFDTAFGAGGRYASDTHTAVSTLP